MSLINNNHNNNYNEKSQLDQFKELKQAIE
jgi:hypothetical protein